MTAPSPPGPGSLTQLHEDTDTVDAALRRWAADAGFTDATVAAALLNVTRPTLLNMITSGDLSAVIVDGTAWVHPAAVQIRLLERAELGTTRTREAQLLARTALRLYLQAHPATGDWTIARSTHRPLVCARRGKNWARHGIEFHSVVLATTWVASWVGEHGITEAPELAAMPVGPWLRSLLEDLAGVEPVGSVTPLTGDGRAHRVGGWVRVSPAEWPVVLSPDVTGVIYPSDAARNAP